MRPSGITTEEYFNANRLPNLDNYDIKLKAKPVPKDTLNKMGIDTSEKKKNTKAASKRSKKNASHQLVAALLERKEDE